MLNLNRLGYRSFEKDADRLDTELFGAELPPGPIGTAAWNHIHLIPPNGATVTSYPVTVTGLTDALTAATVAGSMIWVPPGTFNTAITIPANIALVALGEKVSINGQWTLNSGVVVANVVQTQSSSSAGALSGVVGPSSGIAYMKNCSITVENSGAGDAYSVNQNAAGDLWLWGCATYGNASGGGSGFGVRQSAGNVYTTRDGRHRGSTGKFSGTVQLFDIDDVIHLKTSTFTQLYNATAAGVTAMLAAASSGDVVDFPRHKAISLTSGITLTAGVIYKNFNLSFSGFSGQGITIANNCTLSNGYVLFNGAGQAEATAIFGSGISLTVLDNVRAEAQSATTNTGIKVSGASLYSGVTLYGGTSGRSSGGTTSYGIELQNFTYANHCSGQATGAATTNRGIRFNSASSGDDAAQAFGCWGFATGGYGGSVSINGFGRAISCNFAGDTGGFLVNSGATLEDGGNYWSSITNSGTIEFIPGSDYLFNVKHFGAAGDGTTVDTTAIQDAVDSANTNGGGIVFFPEGTYITERITIYSNIWLVGSGMEATILQLPNTATNTTIIKSDNFDALTGGNTTGGINHCGVRDMTLVGNSVNNTSGYGIRIYGYEFRIENVAIRDFDNDGIYTEWSSSQPPPGTDSMEAYFTNVKSSDNGGAGFSIAGPHDSSLVNCASFENGTYGFHTHTNAGGIKFYNCHAYGPNNTHTYAFYLEKNAHCVNCYAEKGDTAQVFIGDDATVWVGGVVRGWGGVSTPTGFVIGDGTHTNVANTQIYTQIFDCTTAAISFGSDGGAGFYDLAVDQASGTVVGGTPVSTNSMRIAVTGGVTESGRYRFYNGYLDLSAISEPSTPFSGAGRFYIETVGGVTRPFYKDDAGVEWDLLTGSSSAGGSTAVFAPVTDGDIATPEIIFNNGEVVMNGVYHG